MGCVRKIIEERTSVFDEVGLTPELLEPRLSGSGTSFDSEIAIWFWDTNLLAQGKRCVVDLVEFHAVENGQPAMDLKDLVSWLPAVCEDVVDRRRHTLKGE